MPDTAQNIILLSMDALRADHLSCYGYHRETSPVLDKLAAESLQFMNAYSASSHTREAVPALLTGEYPDVAIGPDYHLKKDTIAVTLSEEGFTTGGFHSNPYVSRAYSYDRGFDEFDDDLHLGQHKLIALAQRALDKLRNRHYARAETINERSLEWLDSLDEDEPFFLWNHYMDTHGPYEPPEPYATQFRDDRVTDDEAQSLYNRAVNYPDSITDEERALLIDLYDAEIRYNDAQIGSFLEALRDRGLLEDSLLIVTADHGDAFGEHGYYGHPRYLHDETTHVPMFMRLPDQRSETVRAPVSTLDIVSTLESAFGETPTFSLLNSVNNDRHVFSQARGENKYNHLRRYAARTTEEVCLCQRETETGTIEFTEASDRELRSELEAYITERVRVENSATGVGEEDVNEEIKCRLSALGYKE